MPHPKRILLALDAVLLDYSKPSEKTLGDPLPGAVDAIDQIRSITSGETPAIEIIAHTSRPESMRPLIEGHLRKHGVHVDGIAFRQPTFHAFVDTRAIEFPRDWTQILIDRAIGLAGLGFKALHSAAHDDIGQL